MSANDPAVRISQFLGLRNTVVPVRQPPGALAVADNVDLDDSGALELRKGYSLAAEGTAITASFATRDQRRLFVVDDGELMLFTSPTGGRSIASGIPAVPLYWAEAGDTVFVSGKGLKGMVVGDRYADWAVPDGPAVDALAGGDDPADGWWQAAAVYRDSTGRQGSALPPVSVRADASGVLTVTVRPLEGYDMLVYVAQPNSETLRYVGSSASTTVKVETVLGAPLDRAHLDCMPPPDGDVIEFHAGRIWIAWHDPASDATTIFGSRPFFWHLFDLASDFFSVPGKVLGMKDVSGELIVATDRDIWKYGGNQPDEPLVRLRRHGAIPGYPIAVVPGQTEAAMVWTIKGWFRYAQDSGPVDLTYSTYQPVPGTWCSAAFVEQDGTRRALALTDGGGTAYNPY